MREIVMDTETTGLDPETGDRIVEIGAVELLNHLPTGRVLQLYINPERDMPIEAERVHGLSAAFLRDKPKFAEVAQEFIDFIEGATLVIHNAAFDIGFLNAEFARIGAPAITLDRVVDTLQMARRRFPGSPASLDALCKRLGVDNSAREKHGALLDSEILAEVYLELMGGRQPDLVLAPSGSEAGSGAAGGHAGAPRPAARPFRPRITEAEAEAHAAFVAELGPDSVWARLTQG